MIELKCEMCGVFHKAKENHEGRDSAFWVMWL